MMKKLVFMICVAMLVWACEPSEVEQLDNGELNDDVTEEEQVVEGDLFDDEKYEEDERPQIRDRSDDFFSGSDEEGSDADDNGNDLFP